MSCLSEFTLSVYADGELEGEELRRSEMHLISCRDCREHVVALQGEGEALVNALQERTPMHVAPHTSVAPARDLAWGLPAAIGGVTALIAIVGVLIELRLPGVFDLINPRRLMGVYEMAFDSVFVLRSNLPGLIELVTAVAAVASFSALGWALVHALSQRLLKSSSMLMLLPLVVAFGLFARSDAASAMDFRLDQDTYLPASETVSETLVCAGDVVTIEGTIDGDLVAGAERIVLRGTVTGNVFAFGDEVEIEGVVKGSILVMAGTGRVSGQIDGSLTLVGDRLTVADSARIARDTTIFGAGARVEGNPGRDVNFGGEWIEVRGEIGRDLHVLGAKRVTLLDGARIGRDLRAHVDEGPEAIVQAPGSNVGGEVRVETESVVKEHAFAHYEQPNFYLTVLVASAAALLFGLLVYVLDPRLFEADPPNARGFFRFLGIGFIVVLASPVALVLTGFTVVGIPIAIFGAFLLIGALYTAFVLVAGMIGTSILSPSKPGLGGFAPSLLIGVLILSVLSVVPYVGPAVRIVALLFGVGFLFERVRGLHELNLRGIRTRE